MASSAYDIVQGGLLNINAVSPGEPISAADESVCLPVLNDLVDSLSTDECYIYTQLETIFPWVAGQFQYTVGNPLSPNTFTGTLNLGSAIITVTSFPPDLVANADPTHASDITDYQNVIPPGTTVVTAAGISVTMSAVATANSMGSDVLSYTTPGDIKMNRPLRFRNSFTRASNSVNANQDYAFEFVSFDRYKEELLKNVQGPWPYIAAYQPNFPLGNLYVYPAPGASYTAHLFSDLILSEFATITTPYALPQGYTRSLKKLLGLELCPIYGKTPSPLLITQAKEAKEYLKSLNASPVVALKYDSAIVRSQTRDAGWIISGGFR